MLFSQTFFYFLVAVGIILGLPAWWLFARAKWPIMVSRNRDASSKRLTVSFLIGLPVLGLSLLLGGRMANSGIQPLQVAAVIWLGVVLMWSFAGIAGLATYVGETLWPQFQQGNEAWKATWKGGLVVTGCLLLPFIGWFFLLLVLPFIGAGIQVRSWFARNQPATNPVQPAAEL